jgi:protein-S-isoprenylcysteine O-methyltransferase Ste14
MRNTQANLAFRIVFTINPPWLNLFGAEYRAYMRRTGRFLPRW